MTNVAIATRLTLSERTIEEVYRPSPQDIAAQAFLLEKLGYSGELDDDD